jgi:hypothetical protein
VAGNAQHFGSEPVVNLLLAILLSFLPAQFRSRFELASSANLHRATILSGLLEAAVCVLLYAGRYLYFIQYRVGTITDAAMKARAGEEALGAGAVQFGMGYVSLVEYIFSPLSLLLAFFAIEGSLRLLAAAVAEESPGTLPLYIVAWTVQYMQSRRAERALGPRVVDEVHHYRGISYDLGVASCRPKADWNQLTTIAYEEKFYELFEEKKGVPPRPYIYLLREIPRGKVIRGIYHYSPEEVLPMKK